MKQGRRAIFSLAFVAGLWLVAIPSRAGAAETPALGAGDTGEKGSSLKEVNKQLTSPVSSIWSLTFQFNNFILENDHWNHNMLFQPVLPISLTQDWNLINRPVIPLYDSVPHPIGPDRFR